MTHTSMKSSCYKEYMNRNYMITNVSLQTKQAGQRISYVTTHSAFIFPLEGSAVISFDEKTFLARPGYVVHGSPGHQLSFEVLGDKPFVHLNIYYNSDTLWDGNSDWMHTQYALSIKENQVVEKILESLLQSSQNRNLNDFMQQEILAKQMILRMFGHVSGSDSDYQIVLAAEYMQQNYAKHITLGELADRFQMEENRFSYLFSKFFHIRPIDYLIRLRLRKAGELLTKGYSVCETAESVGYQDALYFSRLFKKHYGFAPSHIKNKTVPGTGKEQHVSEKEPEIILI